MRAFLIAVLFGCASSATLGQSFLLEGQITNGFSLFSQEEPTAGLESHEFGLPEGGYPVDYSAMLSVDTEAEFWTFSFNASDESETVLHNVSGPTLSSEISKNEISVTSGQVAIDFSSFFTDFSINVDLELKAGTWQWAQDCPVCDLQFVPPGASASITSVREIPEPATATLVAFACSATLRVRRRR